MNSNPMNLSPAAQAALDAAGQQARDRLAAAIAESDAAIEARLAEWASLPPEQQPDLGPKPPTLVRSPEDVTDEMIATADDLAREDHDRIDWEATIDNIDGWTGDDGSRWDFGDLPYDDPVFEKIKRGVRSRRKERGA
jgi:hypothetical protein